MLRDSCNRTRERIQPVSGPTGPGKSTLIADLIAVKADAAAGDFDIIEATAIVEFLSPPENDLQKVA